MLKKLTPSAEDRESLEQAEGVFQPLKAELERLCSNTLSKRKQGYVCITKTVKTISANQEESFFLIIVKRILTGKM